MNAISSSSHDARAGDPASTTVTNSAQASADTAEDKRYSR
jgi:hypothetical protein